MNYYQEGYNYYEPVHDETFPPYPTFLDESSTEEYFNFNEGYETARLDFLWGHVGEFVKLFVELAQRHNIVCDEFETLIEVRPGQKLLFVFDLEDFENYL